MSTKPKLTLNQYNKVMRVNRALRTLPGMYQPIDAGSGIMRSWADFHYPRVLDFQFYYQLYKRVGLARAVVNIKTDLCWLNRPLIKDGEDEDETFKAFARRVRLWGRLKHLDTMQSVGHYAGAIIRVADGKPLSEPLEDSSVKLDDIYDITPAWESQLIVGTIDTDPQSERYGLPLTHTYNQRGTAKSSQRDGGESVTVHYSRVWIMNEGAAGNTIYGSSDLEAPYNSLISWAQIIGAGGEGMLRQASARHVLQQLSQADQFTAPSNEQLDAILEALEEMQDDPFSAVPYLGGMELKSIQAQLSNPEHFTKVALQDVAGACGFSSNALIGAQEGQLAGDQNADADKQRAQSRCDNFLSDYIYDIITWLTNKCRDFDGSRLEIEFPDLLAPSDKDKLENAEKMARINQSAVFSGGVVFSEDEIREAAGYSEPMDDSGFDPDASERDVFDD